MSNQSPQPLNQSHCDKLTKVLGSCCNTADLINKCKAAGLDVSQAEAENESQRQLAAGLKRAFFPNQP